MLLATIGGVILYLVLIPLFGYTWSITFAIPFSIGAMAGYGARTRVPAAAAIGSVAGVLAILVLVAGTVFGVIESQNIFGSFCGFIMALLALLPSLVGAVCGWILKRWLRISSFSQREYLSRLILALLFLLPVLLADLEGRHDGLAPTSVVTTQMMNVPPDVAWRSIQFYEQVRRPVPWLLYISGELRPRYTIGKSEKVGDVRVCVYDKGRLVKMVTQAIPGKRLAFRVVRQEQIETRGVVLLDGSFDLEPVDGGKHTLVRLTTRYQPLLTPRWAYHPAEALAVHTLHGHVLAGMRDTAEGRGG